MTNNTQKEVMAKLKGMAATQTHIAVRAAKNPHAEEVVQALELGTAVGLLIALRIGAIIYKDDMSKVFADALTEAGHFEQCMATQMKCILEHAKSMPKDIQEIAGISIASFEDAEGMPVKGEIHV